MRSWLLLALGCAPPVDPAPPATLTDTATCTELTWEDFGEGTMTTWCTPCHASTVTGTDRQGAPVGIDLDTVEGVREWAAVIAAVATDESASMPPIGGPSPTERSDLAEWLACGAPGEPTVAPLGCQGPTIEGDLVITGETWPADVCAVTGDLVVTGALPAAVTLPALEELGGALRVHDTTSLMSLVLPALASPIAELELTRNPGLEQLELPRLEEVQGDLVVTEDGLGGTLQPSALRRVGGSLRADTSPRLGQLSLDRLAEVGGDLALHELPALTVLGGTTSLRQVGGDLSISSTALPTLTAFSNLESVGTVTLTDLPITSLDAFTWLPEAQAIVLQDLPSLSFTRGFHQLTRVEQGLTMSETPVGVLDGFRQLEHVGALTVRGTTTLTLAPLAALREVDADLVLESNSELSVVTALHELTRVGGDLVIRDNPSLSPAAIRDLTNAIATIEGEIVLE